MDHLQVARPLKPELDRLGADCKRQDYNFPAF